jgi:hypothetical protein
MTSTYRKYKSAGLECPPTGKEKMPVIPKGSSWTGGWILDEDSLVEYIQDGKLRNNTKLLMKYISIIIHFWD